MVTISIKILGVNFGKSILDNPKWEKISEGIAKKSIFGTDSLREIKDNRKLNPLIEAVVHRPNLYYSKIY